MESFLIPYNRELLSSFCQCLSMEKSERGLNINLTMINKINTKGIEYFFVLWNCGNLKELFTLFINDVTFKNRGWIVGVVLDGKLEIQSRNRYEVMKIKEIIFFQYSWLFLTRNFKKFCWRKNLTKIIIFNPSYTTKLWIH